MSSKLFLGGLPTAIDVKRLRETFPDLRPGDEITHERVEAALGIPRTDGRYRTVTSAWRRDLFRLDNVEVGAIVGIGFRVLTAEERVDAGVGRFQQGTRIQGRSLRRMRTIRPSDLDAPHQAKLDHAIRVGASVFQAGQALTKGLDPPKPAAQVTQLPTKSAQR